MKISKSIWQILEYGGWVTYPMIAMLVLLWFLLGYRWMMLSCKWTANQAKEALAAMKSLSGEDFYSNYLNKVMAVFNNSEITDKSLAVKGLVVEAKSQLKEYQTLVTSIVAAAPLLGLLGTVVGMIETFDSMTDMALVAQSGGIAGGVSQALMTTQMGLVIAIPGLLFSRYLAQKERKLTDLVLIAEESLSQIYGDISEKV